MQIEVALTEREIAQEFAEALAARDLPEKFFYWSPAAVRAWTALGADSAYADLHACWQQVAAQADQLAAPFGETCSLISLGAGDGARDRLIIDRFLAARRQLRYFPVDASLELLETACAAVEANERVATLGIKADISSHVHMLFAADAADSCRLFLMAGNTLGGFDPLVQAPGLARCLGDGDRLVVDGEIYSETTLERWTTPAAHAFALAPLKALGFDSRDGDVGVELKRDERHDGLYQVRRHFSAGRDLRVPVYGQEVLIQKGERIALNFQYAYSPEAFRWILAQRGGLEVLGEFCGPERRFMAAVCRRRSAEGNVRRWAAGNNEVRNT